MTPVAPRRTPLLVGAFFGIAVTAVLMVVFYLGSIFMTMPQPYFDLFDKLARVLPGGLVTTAIETMVHLFSGMPGVAVDDASKAAEAAIALVIFLIGGGVFGLLLTLNYNLTQGRVAGAYLGFGAALIPGLLIVGLVQNFNAGAPQGSFVTSTTLLAEFMIAGLVLGVLIESYALRDKIKNTSDPVAVPQKVGNSRRNFLLQVGGGAAFVTAAGWGVGRLLSQTTGSTSGTPVAGGVGSPTATPMPTNMPAGTFVAVPGTRLEVTPNRDFFRVDVNIVPPRVDTASWRLLVDGQVDASYTLSYESLLKLPAVEQYATLECISNPVGGNLISNTRWKGVTLKSVLDSAKLRPNVKEIKFTCADGYTESLPLESALDERTLLAYATNDEPISAEHGYPLRLYVPNRFGMKNPKWIQQITAVSEPYFGYWEVRGWDKEAFVKSTSIFDVIAVDLKKDELIPVGGIAFAGDRGISKVEVQVDGGEWQPAQLKDPLSPLTWVLWRYEWPATKGYHTLTVRCTDGKGALQIETPAPLHPDGASGYVSKSQSVS
jgi:DMSO/TMAO reductase YedYZ molybdopterin-dependent catalytic subunit